MFVMKIERKTGWNRGGKDMDVSQIVEKINGLFNITNKEIYASESGIIYDANKKVGKIGYCVNLTLETIEEARKHGVDMMVTHSSVLFNVLI